MKYRIFMSLMAVSMLCLSFTSIPAGKEPKGARSTIINISGEYNPMCGESILITGNLHLVEHTVKNRNKTRVMVMGNYQGVSGYGTESGQRYNITFKQRNIQTIDLAGGQQAVTVWFRENLVSSTRGVVSFSVRGHYVFNADGSIAAQDYDIVFCE